MVFKVANKFALIFIMESARVKIHSKQLVKL